MVEYSLQLFKILLERVPVGLDNKVHASAQEKYNFFSSQENPNTAEVEAVMIHYGRYAWPYWQAEYSFEEQYGKDTEKDLFEKDLPENLKKKWLEYTNNLAENISFDHGKKFEQAFTPEENFVIQEAVIEAKNKSTKIIRDLARGEKSLEYEVLVQFFIEEQKKIEEKLTELAKLKEKTDKWDDEIDNEILFFRKGFAELEIRPREKTVQEKIDFYKGQIEGLEN